MNKVRPPFRLNFKRPSSQAAPEKAEGIVRSYCPEGVRFSSPVAADNDWLCDPLAFGDEQEMASLLGQISEEGYAQLGGPALLLPWESVFQLSASRQYSDACSLLQLPPIKPWRPILQSSGGLTDPDFAVILAGWIAPNEAVVGGDVVL